MEGKGCLCEDKLQEESERQRFKEYLQMLNASSVGSFKLITRLMVRMKMPGHSSMPVSSVEIPAGH